MLTITKAISDQIYELDRLRNDGGLGSVYVDGVYQCRDVRGDPAYPEYQSIINTPVVQAEILRLQWAQQAADRKAREAEKILAQPSTPDNLSDQLAALRLLSGV